MTDVTSNTQALTTEAINSGTVEFKYSPKSIAELVSRELQLQPDRVTAEKPYTELLDKRTRLRGGRGDIGYIVKRDGSVQELDDGTRIKDVLDDALENCLVMRYTSSRGDTAKIYMGKSLREMKGVAEMASSRLSDEEE